MVPNIVVPAPAYVRFASLYGFRPRLLPGGESKGIVETSSVMPSPTRSCPGSLAQADIAIAAEQARTWCTEVNARLHSEASAVPAERLAAEWPLLRLLPSLRPSFGRPSPAKSTGSPACALARPATRSLVHRPGGRGPSGRRRSEAQHAHQAVLAFLLAGRSNVPADLRPVPSVEPDNVCSSVCSLPRPYRFLTR